ncbi:nidogen-like domain-containing protein [Sandaracinus amylolyticus]|uniref:nidogen-like domain-containing protein n=1 Tax=Sandaracinus amylolyticus TaxID=927083 RepID=UPI001F406B45|nr:nidogen-like domain-containing protein [Sandaracinus amylolyticus]UJR78694.1 NIDO domain-containing protein [Sandaracinus amylolyticus]
MRVQFRSSSILALALVLAGALVAPPPAFAAPLMATFGGPAGYGTGTLPANDDGFSSPIDLTTAFPGGLNFFGGPFTQVWVNNNGNITFSAGVSQYTPTAFPVADRPMIAPYWGDVDTRGPRSATSNMVYYHLEPGLLVATWHNVSVYNQIASQSPTPRMDFQLIVRNAIGCRAGDFDVEFRYNRCEWEAGNASGERSNNGLCDTETSGCTPAQAGFDAGNGMNFVEIMGSRTSAIRNLCTTSNVGMPGVWRFSVRGGSVSCPGTGDVCETGMPGACGVGVTRCIGREVECVQIGTSTAERCDGIDNDCNGTVDDGELCSALEVCSAGVCVPSCFEGGCAEGDTCNEAGVCVETACIGVTCPASERCEGGVCVGACAGITCPHGQQCVAGRCTDLCDVITCAEGEICVDGECRAQCPCAPCGEGETCLADGSCESAGCDVVICDPGFYCEAGACLDGCAGAVCPEGQWCSQGDCIDGSGPGTDADAGGGGGGDTDGGGVDGLDGGGGGGRMRGRPDQGCGCRVAPRAPASWLWLMAPLALVALRRRARRA